MVLQPRRGESTYHVDLATGAQSTIPYDRYAEEETIAFFQVASYLYRNDLYQALTPSEFTAYSVTGERLAGAGVLDAHRGH